MTPVEPVCEDVSQLGEGPRWFDDTLWWVDIEGRRLLRLSAGQLRVTPLPHRPGCVFPRLKGGVLLAWQAGVVALDPDTAAAQTICVPEPNLPGNRLNDGGVDPLGRVWIGSMGVKLEPQLGSLYMLDHDATPHRRLHPVSISNGIAWSADGGTMFYIDTLTREIALFDCDAATGELSRRRVLIRFAEADGFPDGMTLDAQGRLWVGMWGGSCVNVVDPVQGRVVERIAIPAANVTACCFGGPDYRTLFVTTAQGSRDALAGMTFACTPGATGLPLRRTTL